MTLEHLFGLLLFAAVSTFTPGPNNALLMAHGISFGFRRSLPMILGVALGFPVMICLIGLGLGQVFATFPQVYTLLKVVGTGYMLFLAWKIANAEPAGQAKVDAKPLGFLQMVMFQWVNPKGWLSSITALATYTIASSYGLSVVAVSSAYLIMGMGSSFTWAAFGVVLKNAMSNPLYFRWVNISLALLLVLSLVPMLRH